MRCCLLIPVYNHPDKLPALMHRLSSTGLATFLVNDGSNAHCSAVMRQLADDDSNVTLIELERNSGKGAAMKAGMRAASRAGYTHAMQVDADGQHNLDDVADMLSLARHNPRALVTGVPHFKNIPRLRYYARHLTHFWVWVNTLSRDIADSMCGFRIYPLAATMAIVDSAHTGDRMDFDSEIMVRLHWAGTPVIELPTLVTYPEDGISHFRGWRDTGLIAWMHTRLFFGMLWRLPRLLTRRALPAPEVKRD